LGAVKFKLFNTLQLIGIADVVNVENVIIKYPVVGNEC
jgi:hypothetical protein